VEASLVAEDLMACLPPSAGGHREDLGWVSVVHQPGPHRYFAAAARVRAPSSGVEQLVAEVCAWFASAGRAEFTWWLGPHTRPTGLSDALIHLGAQMDEPSTAMVLAGEPPITTGIQVTEVTTLEDFALYREILFEVDDDTPDDQRASVATGLEQAWERQKAPGSSRVAFLAWLDGAAVSAGGLLYTDQGFGALSGGATRPSARGAGCYRALVRARWEHARDRGRPSLVVQASSMSRPILTGMGFTTVAGLTILRQASL
jgi:GNAT superfamily N-acetyltransferase